MRLLDHDSWATDHHGLLSRTALGIVPDAWRRATRTGFIQPLHPGPARVPGTARTRE